MTGFAKLRCLNVAGRFGRRDHRAAVFMTVRAGPQGALEDPATVAGPAACDQMRSVKTESGGIVIEIRTDRGLRRRQMADDEHQRDGNNDQYLA